MKRCSYCGRENMEEATTCKECGTTLDCSSAASGSEQKQSEYDFPRVSDADLQKPLVTLVTCPNLGAADAVVARLAAAGIQSFIPDEHLLQGYGLAGAFGFARVQVATIDYDRARELLEGG